MEKKIRGNLIKKKYYELLQIPMHGNENDEFAIGDVVRSYRCGFDEQLPYKFCYTEGVVIDTKDKVLGDKYLVVKWKFQKLFGKIYPVKLPHNNSDTFSISVNSPFLFRVGVLELPFQ